MWNEIKMRKRFVQASTLLAATAMSLPVQAQPLTDRPDYQHYGWDWGWGHMIFGSLMMIIFWGGVILAIVLVVRWLGVGAADRETRAAGKSSLDILNDRFARGEIDRAEYEERKKLLSS